MIQATEFIGLVLLAKLQYRNPENAPCILSLFSQRVGCFETACPSLHAKSKVKSRNCSNIGSVKESHVQRQK